MNNLIRPAKNIVKHRNLNRIITKDKINFKSNKVKDDPNKIPYENPNKIPYEDFLRIFPWQNIIHLK